MIDLKYTINNKAIHNFKNSINVLPIEQSILESAVSTVCAVQYWRPALASQMWLHFGPNLAPKPEFDTKDLGSLFHSCSFVYIGTSGGIPLWPKYFNPAVKRGSFHKLLLGLVAWLGLLCNCWEGCFCHRFKCLKLLWQSLWLSTRDYLHFLLHQWVQSLG